MSPIFTSDTPEVSSPGMPLLALLALAGLALYEFTRSRSGVAPQAPSPSTNPSSPGAGFEGTQLSQSTPAAGATYTISADPSTNGKSLSMKVNQTLLMKYKPAGIQSPSPTAADVLLLDDYGDAGGGLRYGVFHAVTPGTATLAGKDTAGGSWTFTVHVSQ